MGASEVVVVLDDSVVVDVMVLLDSNDAVLVLFSSWTIIGGNSVTVWLLAGSVELSAGIAMVVLPVVPVDSLRRTTQYWPAGQVVFLALPVGFNAQGSLFFPSQV